MRLKKLEIFGFKSFADRTEILFDEGVTCIVGPNGCGKSNISDSVRWVLGERSAKLLRGSKMEDVIFNGTDFRKPLAMAEVSLTFENADRGLPIDYNEVTITRRLYRSGESEYLINKTLCRLKDIQDLILDTGVGSNSYSMIEQGRIDYILNADAEERRFLIEEAAGISKYKVKKEEAVRKLERTEENRLRLNDIIQEVHKNIQYAERQAKRAARYQEEFEKLKRLEIGRAFYQLRELSLKKNEMSGSLDKLKNEYEAIELALSVSRKDQETVAANLHEISERHAEAEATRYGIQSRFDQNQQQLKFHAERRMSMAERRGQIEQEERQLKERLEKNRLEIEMKQAEIESLAGEKEKASEALQSAQRVLSQVEDELLEAKKMLDQIRNEAFQSAAETSRLRNEFHRLSAFLESNQQQKRKHEAGAGRLREESREWQSRKEKYEIELLQVEQRLDELNQTKASLMEGMALLREQIDAAREEIVSGERVLHEKETRLVMLSEIDQSTQENEEVLLSPDDNFDRNLVKTLREIFTVTPGFEWALDAALESFSRAVIADNPEMARKLFSRILSSKPSPIGLFIRSGDPMPVEILPRPLNARVQASLQELIQIRAGYESLFEPFFLNTYILEAGATEELLNELLPFAGRYKFITPEGLVIGPQSRVFFRNARISSEDNPFRRGAEMEMLKQDISELSESIGAKREEMKGWESQLEKNVPELEAVEGHRLDATIQKESLDSMRRSAEDRLTSFTRELSLIDFESQEAENQFNEASHKKAGFEAELQEAERRESQLRDQQETLSRDLEIMDRRKVAALHEFAENKARFTHLEERNRLVTESFTMMKENQDRDSKRILVLREEFDQLIQKEEHLKEEDSRLNGEQEELQKRRSEAELQVELVRQEKTKVETDLTALREAAQELAYNQQKLQGDLHQYEMKVMDLGYQEKNISDRLQQTYRIQLSEHNPEDFPIDIEQIEGLDEKLADLKSKVDSLGTVNLLAIEEYEELKKRYDFLMGQQKDLDEAREQLLETIRKINRTTKGLFEETLTKVQEMFQEYYHTLFKGGQARLVLIDETNPLESGIDIVVRPPGKKLTHITLLSGGEKALTAIALLFALFRIKPSPFCVLDEVDAPLDEANIDRFLGALRTFLEHSQFIIVTHNRKTIAMGDSLYGVTMQEAGVSKLVSVKINQGESAPSMSDAAGAVQEKNSLEEEKADPVTN